jgi:hypothetical protein
MALHIKILDFTLDHIVTKISYIKSDRHGAGDAQDPCRELAKDSHAREKLQTASLASSSHRLFVRRRKDRSLCCPSTLKSHTTCIL